MPHLNYHSDSSDISRIDQKDEDVKALRQSVSVQMHVASDDLTHPSGCGFGLTLFDMQEDPDTYLNVGKKLRILAPTIEGSGTLLQVFLDDVLLGTTPVPNLIRDTITLTEFRFWKDVDKYKVTYAIEGNIVGTISINRNVFTPNVRFRCGVSLVGVLDLKVYNITYAKKDIVARTIALQGTGSITLPSGQDTLALNVTGGKGRVNKYSLGDIFGQTPQLVKVLSSNDWPINIIKLRDTYAVIHNTEITYGGNVPASSTHSGVLKNGDTVGFLTYETSGSRNTSVKFTNDFVNYDVTGINTPNATYPIIGLQCVYAPTRHTLNGALLVRIDDGKIASTYDGVNYDVISGLGSDVNYAINEDGKEILYWAVPGGGPNNGGRLVYCTELSDLKTIHIPQYTAGGSNNLLKVCYAGTGWFALTKQWRYDAGLDINIGETFVWYCGDGVTWSKTDYAADANITAIAFFYAKGNLFIKHSTAPGMLVSTDGGNTFIPTPTTHIPLKYYNILNDVFYGYATASDNKWTVWFLSDTGEYLDVGGFDVPFVSLYNIDGVFLSQQGKIGGTVDSNGDFNSAYYPVTNNDRANVFTYTSDLVSWKNIHLAGPCYYVGKFANFYYFIVYVSPSGVKNTYALIKINADTVVNNDATGISGPGVTFDIGGETFAYDGSRNEIPPPTSFVNLQSDTVPTVSYTAPLGTTLKLSYNDADGTGSLVGKKISTECLGFDIVDKYDAGDSNFYYELVEKNSVTCGYNADTLKTIVLSGQGAVEIPPGITTIKVDGRGSSYKNKIVNLASVIRAIDFDEIRFTGIKPYYTDIIRVEYFKGNYYVLFGRQDVLGDIYSNTSSTALYKGPELNDLTFVKTSGTRVLWQVSDKLIFDLEITTDGTTWTQHQYIGGSWYDAYAEWVGYGNNYLKIEGSDSNYTRLYYTKDNFVTVQNKYLNGPAGYGKVQYARLGDNILAVGGTMDQSNMKYCSNNADATGSPTFYNTVYFTKHDDNEIDLMELMGHSVLNHRVSNMVSGNGIIVFLVYRTISQGTPTDPAFTGIIGIWDGSGPAQGENYARGKLYPNNDFIAPKLSFNGTYFIITDLNTFYYSTNAESWVYGGTASGFGMELVPAGVLDGVGYFSNTCADYDINKHMLVNTVLPGEQYVVKLPEEGKSTTVTVNDAIYSLPGNKLSTAPQTNVIYNETLDINKSTVVVYDVPVGGYLAIEYLAIDDGAPVAGTLLGEFCDGFNLMEKYANGAGGEYTQLIAENDVATCNYAPPVIKSLLSFTETMTISEGLSSVNSFTMSKSLPFDVTVAIAWTFGSTAVADDVGDVKLSINGGAYQVITSGYELEITAGITEFKLEVFANTDVEVEIDEVFTITLTEVTTTDSIIGLPANIDVTITNTNYVVMSTYLSSNDTDDIERRVYGAWDNDYRDRVRGMVGKHGMIRSENGYSSGKYYIPFTGIDISKIIIGFGTIDANINPGTQDHTYPGVDEFSWGINQDYFYHNGLDDILTTSINNNGRGGLLLDLDNKTARYVVNGVTQPIFASNIPNEDIYLLIGNDGSEMPRAFYVDMAGETQPTYTPPVGYYKGFGELVRDDLFVPIIREATDILTPSTFTSVFTEDRMGVVKINCRYGARSTHYVNSGIWSIEFDRARTENIRIGICKASHSLNAGTDENTAAIQLGVNTDSYGITLNTPNAYCYHNGVETQLTYADDVESVKLILNMVDRQLSIKFGWREEILFTDIEQTDWFIAVTTTTQRMNDDGDTIVVNTGRFKFNDASFNQSNPGFGLYINGVPENVIISQSCTGTSLIGLYGDGLGGTLSEVIEDYSPTCGYVLPSEDDAGWKASKLPDDVAISPNGTIFYRLSEGAPVSLLGHATGKRYFETTNTNNNTFVGICTTAFENTNNTPGYADNSLGMDLTEGGEGCVYQNGSSIDDSFTTDYVDHIKGATIGFMLDFDDSTLSIKYTDGTIKVVSGFDIGVSRWYVTLQAQNNGGDWPAINTAINQGNETFINGLPAGYTAWSVESTPELMPDGFDEVATNVFDTDPGAQYSVTDGTGSYTWIA